MSREFDMNWSVEFDVTLDGESVDWFELSESTQSYILEQIANGSVSGTTGGAELVYEKTCADCKFFDPGDCACRRYADSTSDVGSTSVSCVDFEEWLKETDV